MPTMRGVRRRFTLLLFWTRSRAAREDGYSLIESLTTLVILGIVVSGLTTTFVSASRAELDMNRRFQAQEQARLALDQLRRELHCASAVTDVNGSALSPSTSYSAIKVALGNYCESTTSTGFATWCTAGTGPWTLYRIDHAVTACSSGTGARSVASSLTTEQPFSQPTPVSGVGIQLPTLHVVLAVNVGGMSATTGTSRLVDDIALRNAARV
jgi:prepilin-type N-terminal cleavage/methylation domain-containing protein